MFANPSFWMSRLLFVALVIEAFEVFRMQREFDSGGMFSISNLEILTNGTYWQVRVGSATGESTAVVTVAALQAVAAIVVIVFGVGAWVGIIAALLCLLFNSYLRVRRQIGGSGADQLTCIVLVTFGLVMLAGGSTVARRIGDAFIAAQVILAYAAAGVAKSISPVWREGRAMAGILSTEGYGVPTLAYLLIKHPEIDKFLCWSVMLWEISFPLVLVVPKPVMVGILGIGVLFHLSCALLMGLNRFVWAFCGCYPAVWATALLLR
jgi:hypothetical protein